MNKTTIDDKLLYKPTSIIMPAYREPEKFMRAFEMLLKTTSQKETPFEIIIIDNGAEPKLKKIIKEIKKMKLLFVKFINNKNNLGTSKGFNIGAQKAKGYYLCFFNSDYYMSIGWLKSMIDCFEHKKNIGLVSCSTNVTGNDDERCNNEYEIIGNYKESKCAIAQMFTTKNIWEEVGGFDENYFFSHEDLDFNMKIRKKGYKIFVNRKTFGYHDHEHLRKMSCEGHKQVHKSRKYFINKWGDVFPWA